MLAILLWMCVLSAPLSAEKTVQSSAVLPPQRSTAPYLLTRGDVIEVKFFYNPELNETIQIRPDGRISLQLVGELSIADKTISEAVMEIERAYQKELKTPKVSIQVRSFSSQKVFVSGEVAKPGTQTLVGEMTVVGALADAGGVRPTGDQKKVLLVRKGEDGNPKLYQLTVMAKGKLTPEAHTALVPFDVLLVPETKISRADRWVDQYLRQLSPANLAVGFQYLYTKSVTPVIPF